MISPGALTAFEPDEDIAVIDKSDALIAVARFNAANQRLQPHIVFPD
jgi:hypothetical protein